MPEIELTIINWHFKNIRLLFSSLRLYRTDKLRLPFRLVSVVLFLSSSFLLNAQQERSEIGIELGGYNYLGDVVRKYDFANHSFGANFFIRQHMNDAWSFRLSAGFGGIQGVDDGFDIFSTRRRASFDSDMIGADLLFEYHFLNYKNPRLAQYWTPYISFGLGAYRVKGVFTDGTTTAYNTGMVPRIPVGIGVKLKLSRRVTLGVSTSAIVTNSDQIDNIFELNSGVKSFVEGDPHNDWIFFTGISLSYTFYKILCPVPFFRDF